MRWRAVVLVAIGFSPAAHAGALGQVVGGLAQATGSTAHPAPSGSAAPQISGPIFAESAPTPYPAGVVPVGLAPPPSSPGPDVTLELSLGLMAVHDSDGAAAFEVGFVHDDFGLFVRGRSFFEQQEQTASTLRLDLGSITADLRVIASDGAELWLEGGVGGVATIDDIHAYGAVAGGRIERKLFGDVSARAIGRYYFLADDIRLLELAAGFRVSAFDFSYRLFSFNVGPPLHGPEVGITLRF
jgi:hypothetical protein